jgi:tripartite-type tricarboxylate transporter receptor subunit TctC
MHRQASIRAGHRSVNCRVAQRRAGWLSHIAKYHRGSMPAMRPVKTRVPRLLLALACGVAAGSTPAAEDASAYPSRAVTIVVGFAPGGASDITARLLAGRLTQALGKPFIVENRPGADSNIGTEQVVRTKPDGYTLLLETIANATNMSAYKRPGYDTERDLVPIIMVMTSPSVLVVTPSLPVKDLRALIALARAQPGRLSFASSGTGGSTHLAGELLKMRAGLDVVHIPYKGAAPAMADVVAGHVSMGFLASLGALSSMQSGHVRPIAVAHSRRLPELPDVPTMAEAGMADLEVSSWNGLAAPVGTPQPIIDKLNAEVNKILALPEVQRQLQGLGAQAVGGSARQFASHKQAQIQKWRDVVKAAGITLD